MNRLHMRSHIQQSQTYIQNNDSIENDIWINIFFISSLSVYNRSDYDTD